MGWPEDAESARADHRRDEPRAREVKSREVLCGWDQAGRSVTGAVSRDYRDPFVTCLVASCAVSVVA